jgi:hypothetical protein
MTMPASISALFSAALDIKRTRRGAVSVAAPSIWPRLSVGKQTGTFLISVFGNEECPRFSAQWNCLTSSAR